MKIEFTVEALQDGGAMIIMDPSAEQLIADVESGKGTAAHTYALIAYRALMEAATRAGAASGWTVNIGELLASKH